MVQRVAPWVFCAMALAHPARAQETINYASVSGRVTDPSGAVVAGAHVIARQIDTNVIAEASTDPQGRFRFPYLKVGPYEILVQQTGFADAIHQVTLTVGSAFDLPIPLSVGALSTDVTVTAPVVVLEAARSQIASTISQAEVKSLPMNGRNFLDLAMLAPGVAPANVGSTQLFAETSAVPGQGISVGSQRNFSNSFIVDGLSANDDAAGLSGIPYGVDAVDQFQVVTSGGQAELGRALGGYVNVVTKSGTNTVRGDVYGYFRDDALNAANALSGTRLPMNQQQYGGSLGGPIVRNRSFFFANVEQRKLEQSGLVTISAANVAAINARLAAVGYKGAPVASGVFRNPVDSTNFMGKIDHSLSGRDQLSVRYSQYNVASENSRGAGALNAPSASAALDNIDRSLAFGNTWSLSDRTVNETRAQLSYGDLRAPATDPIGPAVTITGVASFGTASGGPTRRVNKLYQVVNNLSHQAGAHALRAGVDVLYNDDTITFPRSVRGAYTFSSLANFLSGTYNAAGYTQTFGASEITQTNPNIGVYGQDEFRLSPSLTLNAGLRYDLQFLEAIDTDRNNVSPRVGFAWSPSSSHKTIVRGSAGVFFDRVPLRALANALLSAGNTTDLANLRQTNITLSPTQAGAPVFPNTLGAPIPSVTLFNLQTMNRRMQNAYSRQASVEVERQLGPRSTVGVGYQYMRGRNLIVSVNQNVPTCVASGTNNGCRPVSAYANANQYQPLADSNYYGFHVTVVQRPSKWGSYRLTYTLSKSMNNVGENFFSSPSNPYDISTDWGRSDDDQRHRLVINGSINSPMGPARNALERVTNGFQFSAIVQYYSTLPFNITSGVNSLQGTAGRPLANGAASVQNFDVRSATFIERNSGVGADFFTLNTRLSRTFRLGDRVRLEAMLEAFNLTNRRNELTRNGNFGSGAYPANPSSSFNTITAVGEPRSLQCSFRLGF
jgi:hypothetical protein